MVKRKIPSSLLGPDILLSTLLSNTLNLCSSLIARDQVLHPCRAEFKIMVAEVANAADFHYRGT
jgi:hypothetical protein